MTFRCKENVVSEHTSKVRLGESSGVVMAKVEDVAADVVQAENLARLAGTIRVDYLNHIRNLARNLPVAP